MIKKKYLIVALFLLFMVATYFCIEAYKFKQNTLGCDLVVDRGERIKCWQEKIELLAKTKGAESALSLLSDLRKTDLLFSSDCHVYAHIIGQLSYWEFWKTRDFNVSSDMLLCEYGFYHGFMMEMGHHDPNFFDTAPPTCLILTRKFGNEKEEDALNQCYHGIGHGLVFFYVDKYDRNEAKIIEDSLSYCHKTVPPGNRLKDCIYGVYGGISSLYLGTHGYLWNLNPHNPFWVCDTQPEEYRGGCTNGLVPAVISYWVDDLKSALGKIENVENLSFAQEAIFNAGIGLSHKIVTHSETPEAIIKICQSLGRNLDRYCIKGLAQGVLIYSLPDISHKAAINFCESSLLSRQQKLFCYKGLKEKLEFELPNSLSTICSLTSGENQVICDQAK